MDRFFSFIYDGEFFELEYASKRELFNFIDYWWEQTQLDSGTVFYNGDVVEDVCAVVEYRLTDIGTPAIINQEEYIMEFEYYHGDYAEHNIMYVGGAL